MLDEMRRLSPAARLLVVNQAGVNLGFFMVVPFLAAYLIDDIGMTAAAVGLVLGARTLAQQGLFLPSGMLIDRIGPWPSIVTGCALRVVAFLGLGLAKDPLVALASVLLIGAAGALFQPASRAYLALEATERRAQAFAVFEVWATPGRCWAPSWARFCSPSTSRSVAWWRPVSSASSPLRRSWCCPAITVVSGRRPPWSGCGGCWGTGGSPSWCSPCLAISPCSTSCT